MRSRLTGSLQKAHPVIPREGRSKPIDQNLVYASD